MGITLDKEYLKGFIEQQDLDEVKPSAEKAHSDLENKTGKGCDYVGWMDLPGRIDDSFIIQITQRMNVR